MRIHEVRCRFGRLDGQYALDPSRLTLVVEENERGKTTLTEAILAALYGFPPRQREGNGLRERDRYLPLNGGPCFVELELTAAGRHLRLRRDLNGGNGDTLRITDIDRATDVTAEYAPSKSERAPGEALTGLSRDQFLRICLVRQGQLSDVRDGASLTQRIEALVDTTGGERTANAAVEALTLGLTKFQGEMVQTGKVETEIERLEKAAIAAREQREQYEGLRDAVDADARRLSELEAAEVADEAAARRLAYLAAAAELTAMEESSAGRAEREQRAAQLRGRIAELAGDSEVPVDAPARLEAAHRAVTDAQTELRARQDAMRLAEQERQDADTRLAELGPAATWRSDERDQVLAAEQRLTHAEHAAATAAAGWERAFHNASEETRRSALEDTSPFAGLTEPDRRALLAYPTTLASAHLEATRGRSPLAGRRVPLLIAGAAFLAAGIGVLFFILPLGIALAVIGVALAAAGWFLPAPGGGRTAGPVIPARVVAVQNEGARLAALVGMPSPEAAAAALAGYLATHGAAIELRAAQQALTDAEHAVAEARATLAEWWASAGRAVAPEELDTVAADELVQLAGEVRDRAEVTERLATRAALAEEEAERAAANVRAARAEWRSLCRSLELSPDHPEEAITRIRERAERRQARDRIEQELRAIGPIATPTMRLDRAALVDEGERRSTLAAQLASALAAHPELAELTPERDALSYQQELQALSERRAARQSEREGLLLAVSRTLDDVRQHLPAASQTEQEKEQRLSAVRQFRNAVTLARETLERVAGEAHEAWAEELNARAGTTLGALAPGYAEARFSQKLELNLLDAEGRAWSAAEQQGRLSQGVRDRIYLAVRLALAGYCSPEGEPLPLILDDPFATSDDERAAAGLRFLLEEVAPRHQVLLLTCHRARHDALRMAAPALWQERVHQLSLGATLAGD